MHYYIILSFKTSPLLLFHFLYTVLHHVLEGTFSKADVKWSKANQLSISWSKIQMNYWQILTNRECHEYNKVTTHFYFLLNLERVEKVKIVIVLYVNVNYYFVVK